MIANLTSAILVAMVWRPLLSSFASFSTTHAGRWVTMTALSSDNVYSIPILFILWLKASINLSSDSDRPIRRAGVTSEVRIRLVLLASMSSVSTHVVYASKKMILNQVLTRFYLICNLIFTFWAMIIQLNKCKTQKITVSILRIICITKIAHTF